MGPYCHYCRNRCFVVRRLPNGRTLGLATCPAGMTRDRRVTGGFDHRTALNPVTGRRDQAPDARRIRTVLPSGPTLNAKISAAVIADLDRRGQLTTAAIAALAGVPEVYAVRDHRKTYSYC